MIAERTTYRVSCNGCGVKQPHEYDDPRDAVFDACRAGWECAGREEFCPACRAAGDALQSGQAAGWWTLSSGSDWTADVAGVLIEAETPALLLARCEQALAGLADVCG